MEWQGLVHRLAWVGALLAFGLLIASGGSRSARCQGSVANPASSHSSPGPPRNSALQFEGLPVLSISFEGVPADQLQPLAGHLALAEGAPLTEENLKRSLRQLYSTGLYDTIEARGTHLAGGVALVFAGNPRTFIATVSVDGATGATMNMELQRASQLEAGSRLTQEKMLRAVEQMRSTLEQSGYYESVIAQSIVPRPRQQLADISFHVVSGPRARVGKVAVTGDSGMTVDEFRTHAHLWKIAHVDHDTVNRALDGVLRAYQKQDCLEAEVKLESAAYDRSTKAVDYHFSASRGPVVRVEVHGASIDSEHVKHIIPIYQEGSVDEDLLNEGNRRLRDYYQRLGYFDARVDHERRSAGSEEVTIVYNVELGPRRRVEQVAIAGNHYFSTSTLTDLLSVHAADVVDHHGLYSQALVSADVSALENVYRNNGFSQVKITPETSTPETAYEPQAGAAPPQPAGEHTAPLKVVYRIAEGQQLRVGVLQLQGNNHIATADLAALLNTATGQMLSPRNLAGDHDALVTAYLSRGFEQAAVTVTQQPESADSGKVDVVFHIDEGPQTFIRNVLLTGLENTRPQTVARAITVHDGDPLDQNALAATQSNLYAFALFNEVDTAVVNPAGDASEKDVLIQAIEARRWTLTYGFGFEAQTGQPQNNCRGAFAAGVACNPNGKTGVSPRVLAAITRNGLFGREQSASLRGTYGLLEQSVGLLYQVPHIEGNPNFGVTFSGGYANSEDVSTYVASRLEGAFRGTENFNHPGSWLSRANTFIYEIDFRRVKVEASSLQVYPAAISELSTATRVGGPAFTWIRDTRDVPLDAHRGTYTSFQEFLSDRLFGAQAEFNRIDISNSSYYSFDKNRFVVARNTRYGQIRTFGNGSSELIPLPERLYAGGPVSLRGFSQNAAGPRDPETGYQIGGAGALTNSTELRLPPPTLPWFGNTMSFVIFHDMGNVFTNAGDAWASALRVRQPDGAACRTLADPSQYSDPNYKGYTPGGPTTSTGVQGLCSFNDFSHAVGTGLRYHTPIGPIRFDFSYNLNPPIYPVNINYSIPVAPATPNGPYSAPYVGQAPHINFFFSLGQAF
ncbi:MAG: POTRA domain-containing protein [Terracidiphilus sp.]|jgi:outer membrane protein assembly complex protein YaeT